MLTVYTKNKGSLPGGSLSLVDDFWNNHNPSKNTMMKIIIVVISIILFLEYSQHQSFIKDT